MIKLHIAINKFTACRAKFELMKGRKRELFKQHLDRRVTSLKSLEHKINGRFPKFIGELANHVSVTVKDQMNTYTEYERYSKLKKINELMTSVGISRQNQDLLNKFSFMLFAYGRNRANHVLELIINKHIKFNYDLFHELKRIRKYKQKLIERYPNCSFHLEAFEIDCIKMAQEIREIKIEKEYRPFSVNFDEKAIVNLTKLDIPEDILLALSFGPKFCFPPSNRIEHIITFLDYFIEHLELSFPMETHFEAYRQLSIEMSKNVHFVKPDREIWLDFLNYRISSFKRLNKDVCITKSDKGKHTVLINKCEYIKKMDELVVSTEDYIEIGNVDITKLEQRNNSFVRILRKQGTIQEEYCYNYCTLIAQMYGLIKIHKENFPVRPITAACSAPGFALSKFFTNILSKIFYEDGFHIKNSKYFVEKIKTVNVYTDEVMISFDVVSMFTNIPIEHMLNLIEKRSDLIFHSYKIDFKFFRVIMLFLLRDCAIFSWDNTSYRQKDSLAMGSPMSPILAKILMTDVIKTTLSKLKHKPKCLALYVDDSFWVVKRTEVNHILDILNSYHDRIKFTVEIENNKQINFLDITITRVSDRLVHRWFKKPYASSRLLNYFSHHEKACIMETAKAYVRMVLNLSDPSFYHENEPILIDILRKNSFPETEIMSVMYENYTFMKPLPKSCGFDGKYVPIKYRGCLTQKLKYKIHPFLDGARLVGVPDRTNSKQFSYLKDSIDIKLKTNLVIICSCVCRTKLILRRTNYHERADKTIALLQKEHFSADNKCTVYKHVFNKVSGIQCKNFPSTKRIYNMLAYTHRRKLFATNYEMPEFKISGQLDIYTDKNA